MKALVTASTELSGVRHPIALTPMGGAAGGSLAAAVSNRGGLGLAGGGNPDASWLARELTIAAAGTSKPCCTGQHPTSRSPRTAVCQTSAAFIRQHPSHGGRPRW